MDEFIMFINPNNFLLLINIRHSLTNFLYLPAMELKPLSTWMDFISTSNYAAIIFSLQVLTLDVAYHL